MSDGAILTGSQVVRVYGQNLTAPFVTLTFGDVEYTPLTQGEGYIEFILGDNGTATISVDGSPFMSFEVEGIVVPESLRTGIGISQKNTVSLNASTGTNYEFADVYCVNYDYKASEELPYYSLFHYCTGDYDVNDYYFYNCALEQGLRLLSDIGNAICVSIIDISDVAYISYKGFIVAVFNYTTD